MYSEMLLSSFIFLGLSIKKLPYPRRTRELTINLNLTDDLSTNGIRLHKKLVKDQAAFFKISSDSFDFANTRYLIR